MEAGSCASTKAGTSNHREAGVQLWEAETGKMVRRWDAGHVTDARFAPDGRRFLTADFDSGVRLWGVDRREPLCRFLGHTGWVTKVRFSPDGKTALSSGYDKTVRLWRIPE